ncbi:proteasome subunit beta [Candidatus Woesearchaeota archaeon]|nr:proteasome subunit beta [Candidatus Woesearchaeota archaeon]
MTEKLKTGTTTIGIVCSDGIVLAADKRMTGGSMIMQRDAEKVFPLVDNIVVTIAGVVSEIQRAIKFAKAELKLLEVRTNRSVTVKDAANLLNNMAYVSVRQMGEWGVTGFLVGGKDVNGFSLYEVGADGTLKKHDKFIADGSGMLFALPTLELKYKKGLATSEGVKLAVEAIDQAQLRDSASGNGFDVYTITEEGFKKVISKDITSRATI